MEAKFISNRVEFRLGKSLCQIYCRWLGEYYSEKYWYLIPLLSSKHVCLATEVALGFCAKLGENSNVVYQLFAASDEIIGTNTSGRFFTVRKQLLSFMLPLPRSLRLLLKEYLARWLTNLAYHGYNLLQKRQHLVLYWQ